MSEAFIYLWYDALNKMYYLGSSIGKDPNYAHSSSVMESFTMKTKPAHMHRKKLDFGTHEEMLALESKLQANRKERCWDRYYNVNVCEPFYGGFGSGENNSQWKGGISYDKKAYMKEYKQSPKYLAYEQTLERKAYLKEWHLRKKAERQGVGTLKAFLK
jgi:hypothetical protein